MPLDPLATCAHPPSPSHIEGVALERLTPLDPPLQRPLHQCFLLSFFYSFMALVQRWHVRVARPIYGWCTTGHDLWIPVWFRSNLLHEKRHPTMGRILLHWNEGAPSAQFGGPRTHCLRSDDGNRCKRCERRLRLIFAALPLRIRCEERLLFAADDSSENTQVNFHRQFVCWLLRFSNWSSHCPWDPGLCTKELLG